MNDRIVHKVLNDVLVTQYFKRKFDNVGIVGSVEGNSLRKIIEEVIGFYKQGYVYVLKTDIIDYFPSINRDRLWRVISYYIDDLELKKYVKNYLKISHRTGVPQGSPLSPLMANIFLMSFDSYLTKRKQSRHIRYLDDILVFCKTKAAANKAYCLLKKRLDSLSLQIHPLSDDGKTKIDILNSGSIDFLGVVYKDEKLLIKKKKIDQFRHETISPLARVTSFNTVYGTTKQQKLISFINRLNYQLNGWGGTYSFCNEKNLFARLDSEIERNMRILLTRLHHPKPSDILRQVIKLSELKSKPLIRKNEV